MRDWRKIILLTLSIVAGISIIGTVIYITISYMLKEERPPLDVPNAYIVNYKGEYDNIALKELGVNFDIKSGGKISKNADSFNIKGDKYLLNLEIIPFNVSVLKTNDSLKKHQNENIKYEQFDNIELTGKYNEAYGKIRGDIYVNMHNQLVRVLKESTFKNNNIPIGSIEVLTGEKDKIYKIYITYLGQVEEKEIRNKYVLNEDDKNKGLDYHSYYQNINESIYEYDVIGFGGVYNDTLSKRLNSQILSKTNINFQAKYGMILEEDELEFYKEKISKDKNRYFNAITFKRIIVKDNNIYLFTYETLGKNIELVNIFNNNFKDFFIKNIEIGLPEVVLGGVQDIFNNIQLIIPITHIKKEQVGFKDKFTILPSVKLYKKGAITINTNRKETRNESIDDVYKKNIRKYLTESLSIANRTITNVELIKSEDVNIGGFDGKGNIFKFETVNNDDFIYIEYILFDTKMYYTIGFSYGNNEKELTKYFDEFIKSINKIK